MENLVIPTAQDNNADYYNHPPDLPPDQWMKSNQDWINQKMDEGCTILDGGAAPGRSNFPNPTSPYYQMEQQQIRSAIIRIIRKYLPQENRMVLKITKVGDNRYDAKSVPPDKRGIWATKEPLSIDQLIEELKKQGYHQTDIGDAFYETDPDWLSKR